jgi:phosphohistidine phosphatase SixA
MTDRKPPQQVVLGHLTPEANQVVQAMRRETSAGLLEIGRLELRKHQILGHLSQMEEKTRELLGAEAERIGIPEGASWELTQDGIALGPSLE